MYIHLAFVYKPPPFASQPTFARIDFLRQGERLVGKMGTHNVKIYTKKRTKWGLASGCFEEFSGWQVGNNGVKHHFFWDQGPSLTRKLQRFATHFNAQCHVNSPLLCCIQRVNAWQLPTSSNAARMQLLHNKGLSTRHWAIGPVWVGLIWTLQA